MPNYFIEPSQNKITFKRMLEKLPEYQKRKRRATSLRKTQAEFEAMGQDRSLGGVMGPVTRGLTGTSRVAFDPIGTYVPNYQGIGDRIAGGIGSILSQRKADKEEEELDALRNPEILAAVQQRSQDDPVAAEMAKTLGVAPDPKAPTNPMAPEPPEAGGPPAPEPGTETLQIPEMTDEQNAQLDNAIQSLEARGIPEENIRKDYLPKIISQITGAPMPAPGTPVGMTSEPVAPAPPAPPAPPDTAQAMNETLGMGGVTEQPLPQEATGAMPPPAPEEPLPTDQTLNAYLGLLDAGDVLGKDFAKGRRIQSRFEGENGNMWVQWSDSATPEDTGIPYNKDVKPVQDENGRWIPVGEESSQYQGGKPGAVTPTSAQLKGAEKKAEVQAEYETAPLAATTEATVKGAGKEAELTTENRIAAQSSLPTTRAQAEKTAREVDRLLESPGLDGLLTGVGGMLESLPFGTQISDAWFGTLEKGSPEADAYASHKVLVSDAFLQSYKDALRGTGPVSNVEGLKGAQANLQTALSQSPEMYKQRLQEFKDEAMKLQQRIEEAASQPAYRGPAAQPSAPAPTGNIKPGWKLIK